MNEEFEKLNPKQQLNVRRCIEKVRTWAWRHNWAGRHKHAMNNNEEAYAYQGDQGTHWGVNGGPSGYCIARGIWPKDKPV